MKLAEEMFDLHIHSKYSFDSFSQPGRIVKLAEKRGLRGIAITDHNNIGIRKSETKNEDVIVITGCEFNTDVGDVLGLFLDEYIDKYNCIELIESIKSQGGVSVLAHPFKKDFDVDSEVLKKIDAIEGFNSRLTPEKNEKATEIGKQYNLPLTGGSDAHFYHEIGKGMTVVTKDVYDPGDVREAILKGQTKVQGVYTSQLFEYCSQGIKILKTRRVPKTGKVKRKLSTWVRVK